MNKPIIIAIDGYSSCGKSTLAKALSNWLTFAYVDTGAMYRAVSLYFLRNKLDGKVLSIQEIENTLDQISITFEHSQIKNSSDTFLNGENVEDEIRGKAVSQAVSEVSQIKAIRSRMVQLQQSVENRSGLIMDGRDIGTKVFPQAQLKLFMTADPQIRAQRRYNEMRAAGKELTLEEVEENLKSRDYNDTNRKENPLRQAQDAIVLDNSHLDQEQQLEWVLKLLKKRKLI